LQSKHDWYVGEDKPDQLLILPYFVRGVMKFITEKELADTLKVSVPKLRLDRVKRRGLPFYKIGKRLVRYDMDQIMKVLEDNQITK